MTYDFNYQNIYLEIYIKSHEVNIILNTICL
jgi:hypothetical protein